MRVCNWNRESTAQTFAIVVSLLIFLRNTRCVFPWVVFHCKRSTVFYLDRQYHTHTCMHAWRLEREEKQQKVLRCKANWAHTRFKLCISILLSRGLFGATISVIVVIIFCGGLHLRTLFMQWIYDNCNNGFEANAPHFHSFALAHLTHSEFFLHLMQIAINAFFLWCKFVFMNCFYSVQFANIFDACAKYSLCRPLWPSLFIHFIIQFV